MRQSQIKGAASPGLTEEHHCQKARATRKIVLARPQLADCHLFEDRVNKHFTFCLLDGEGRFLGVMSLMPGNRLNAACFEVGYWIAKPYARLGIGTAALKALIAVSFYCLEIDRLEVFCAVDNDASQGLIKTCGFAFEGELKNVLGAPTEKMLKAGYSPTRDGYLYALTPALFETLPWADEVAQSVVVTPLQGEPFRLKG